MVQPVLNVFVSSQEAQQRSHALMMQFQRFAMTAQMRTEVLKGNVSVPTELLQAQASDPVPFTLALTLACHERP